MIFWSDAPLLPKMLQDLQRMLAPRDDLGLGGKGDKVLADDVVFDPPLEIVVVVQFVLPVSREHPQ